MPPARTAWTSESGATDIAATWKTHAPAPITQPIVNSGEANRALADRQRPAHVHRRRRAGSPVLVQEADIRGQSAQKREEDAEEMSSLLGGGASDPCSPHDVFGSASGGLERSPDALRPDVRGASPVVPRTRNRTIRRHAR